MALMTNRHLFNILPVLEREIRQGECWKHRIRGLWQRKRLHKELWKAVCRAGIKLSSVGQVLQEPGTGCPRSREGICGSEQRGEVNLLCHCINTKIWEFRKEQPLLVKIFPCSLLERGL